MSTDFIALIGLTLFFGVMSIVLYREVKNGRDHETLVLTIGFIIFFVSTFFGVVTVISYALGYIH